MHISLLYLSNLKSLFIEQLTKFLKNNPQYFDLTIPISVCFSNLLEYYYRLTAYIQISREPPVQTVYLISKSGISYICNVRFSLFHQKIIIRSMACIEGFIYISFKTNIFKISYFKRILFLLLTIISSDFNASRISLSTISLSTPTTKLLERSKRYAQHFSNITL